MGRVMLRGRRRWTIRVGLPGESFPGEQRVVLVPDAVRKLRASGFEVVVGQNAGAAAGFPDAAFVEAGAEIVAPDIAWQADLVLRGRSPSEAEVGKLREGAILAAVLQPERHPGLIEALVARKVTAIALERIPRVSRAQKMDVLSSMANLAGYRAVIEAVGLFRGNFGPLVTAAGTSPPAKVLVIGAGVAGLAAIAAARGLGAEVRAFDTRAAAREQVESLGAKFLTISLEESGDGGGGYAKVMSPEFIAAEMALFEAQAREVDVIITTALVPGTKAPILVPRHVVEALRPGSVVMDLAAEQGGNCELTTPGGIAWHNGVAIFGHTDLTSRVAPVASRFFAANLVALLAEMGGGEKFNVNLDDEVIRPAVLVHLGEVLPAPPRKDPQPIRGAPMAPPAEFRKAQQHVNDPNASAWGQTVGGVGLLLVLFVIGRFAPAEFLQHFTVFVLACFVGWQVIWSVTPALHTPLMSVTNAISGIIVVGGMLRVGGVTEPATWLGAIAVFFASINIAGGFLVTERMLGMFHKGKS